MILPWHLGRQLKLTLFFTLRWHEKDVRKIRRSLQVFYTTGKRHGEIMQQQKQEALNTSSLRYKTLLFWLYAPSQDLYPRLDSR